MSYCSHGSWRWHHLFLSFLVILHTKCIHHLLKYSDFYDSYLPRAWKQKVAIWIFDWNALIQGCQMAYFQAKNSNLGKFRRVLQWKTLVYFRTIWSYLRPFSIFCGHLVYFMVIWYIFPVLVCCTKKSGNPALIQSLFFLSVKMAGRNGAKCPCLQGCQIFLRTTYQNWGKIYLMTLKYLMSICTIYQHSPFHCETLQNLPKLVFLVWNYTIWQPWLSHVNVRGVGAKK
jgi:hypothetical protein